jgi:hypothetical protein
MIEFSAAGSFSDGFLPELAKFGCDTEFRSSYLCVYAAYCFLHPEEIPVAIQLTSI